MSFAPDLQARINAAKAAVAGVPVDDSELAVLKRKLASRDGQAGFKANCEELRARIAELENDHG